MPLFVYLSGFATGYSRSRSFGDRVRKRSASLLIPYAAWTCIYLVIYGMPPVASNAPLWLKSLTLVAQGPWYLLALFVFDLAVGLGRIERGGFADVLKVAALTILAYGLSRIDLVPGWHLWDNISRLLPFFALGYLVNVNERWRQLVARTPSAALAATYAVALGVLWPVWGERILLESLRATAPLGANTDHLVFIVGWSTIFVAGLCGTLLIERLVRTATGRVLATLCRVGSQSLGIYLIHSVIIRAWPGTGGVAVATSFGVALLVSYWIATALSRVRATSVVLLGGR